jgi:hypothetical protein
MNSMAQVPDCDVLLYKMPGKVQNTMPNVFLIQVFKTLHIVAEGRK